MGLRFRKSITLLPGVRLNLSKSGASVSVGKKGMSYNLNTKGKSTVTLGIPGTGVSYSKSFGGKKSTKSSAAKKRKELDEKKEKLSASKASELEQNELQVQEYENYVELIKSVHEECDDAIDWQGDKTVERYYDCIEKNNPFQDLLEYGSGFEFGTDNLDYMEIEFAVKSEDVVPAESVSLTKTGAISTKELTKTAYYDLTQDYVCSTSIRLAREIFALLPVRYVVVHAVDTILNTATGNEDEETILSIEFDRSGFENINFQKIDPSDFVESFPHNMKFQKTAGFKPVDRLEWE